MIRKIIASAAPAALLVMAGALSAVTPANAQFFDDPVTRATSGTNGAGAGGTTIHNGGHSQQFAHSQPAPTPAGAPFGGAFGGALLTSGSFTMMVGSGGF